MERLRILFCQEPVLTDLAPIWGLSWHSLAPSLYARWLRFSPIVELPGTPNDRISLPFRDVFQGLMNEWVGLIGHHYPGAFLLKAISEKHGSEQQTHFMLAGTRNTNKSKKEN